MTCEEDMGTFSNNELGKREEVIDLLFILLVWTKLGTIYMPQTWFGQHAH